jgi:hypothetical protein
MCPILKKLRNKLQPYREVTQLIGEILVSTKGNYIRVLEHLLSFAEHQFGKKVTGKHYRGRGDGDRISNWIVEIKFLNFIITALADLYIIKATLSNIMCDNMSFPYFE